MMSVAVCAVCQNAQRISWYFVKNCIKCTKTLTSREDYDKMVTERVSY